MPWAKLDDRFLTNPKVRRAGLAGRMLYVASLTYSAGELTDGFIPTDQLDLLAYLSDVPLPLEAAAHLVTVGLWEVVVGGWAIHDYHNYNPSSTDVRATREKRKVSGHLGGLASGASRRQAGGPPDPKPAEANGKQVASALLQANAKQSFARASTPVPNPARPLPVPTRADEGPTARGAGTALPASWAVTPALRAYAEREVPGVDVDREEAKFRDHAATHGRLAHNWDAAFRQWFRTDFTKAMLGGRGAGHRNRDNEGDEVAEGLRILGNLRRERAAPGPAIEAHWRAADD
jgi:hypothetical protein